jgi:pantetheine-phosphate adenylyltransferase
MGPTASMPTAKVGRLKRAICPGTFDPVTYGHLDVIVRAASHFDEVIVAVSANPEKQPLFNLEEREAMLNECLADKSNIRVVAFDGLLVDLAKKHDCVSIVKGLRAMSDFEFEFQMSQFNRQMDGDIETFFIMASPEYTYLSSSGLKEVAKYGGCVSGLVPVSVEERLLAKLGDGK